MNYTNWVYDIEKESKKIQKWTEKNAEILSRIHDIPIKKAAVLIPIFQYNGTPHVILTERSKHLRTHAGQVSLPGGKVDDEDENYIDTALREAEEEIGLQRKHVKIIGAVMPAVSSISKVIITPVVGFISDIYDVKLSINENEVSSVFAVPLEYFLIGGSDHIVTVKGAQYNFPRFFWDCKTYAAQFPIQENECLQMLFNGTKMYKIWGITGMILLLYASFVFEKKNFPDGINRSGLFKSMISDIIKENRSKL